MQLNRSNFTGLPKRPERVLQFGEGNFLRAFVDWMVHQLNQETDFNSSVVVVQPLPQGMVSKLNEQDGLYTVFLNGIKDGAPVTQHTVVDCISRGIEVYGEYDEYLRTAANPDMRFIVSNTTEAGIAYSAEDKLTDAPAATFPAKLTAWLYHRYQHFAGARDKGLIILPCELIEENGAKLKAVVLQYAQLWQLEPRFRDWLHEANIFCNTLVDRIVPGYPRERAAKICQDLGYEDQLLVEGEQFHLWVIQGPASIRREIPADQAGLHVLFVDDLTPYRTRKVRILNGAHTSMVPVAYLCGLATVREAVEDSLTGRFISDAIYREIVPTLDLPQAELEQFAGDVVNRFKNPYIKHQLLSIALNSTAKFGTRVLPSILEYQQRQQALPRRLVFSLAALIAFYKGVDGGGEEIPLADSSQVLEDFALMWAQWDGSDAGLSNLTRTVLGWDVWPYDLNQVQGLTALVSNYLSSILSRGMKAALSEVV